MNQVHLLGRLTADPEPKATPAGVPYCRFRIAVKRKFAKESDVKADFFNVVAWNKQAEFVAGHFMKGDPIIVHGEIRNSDYTDKNNVKHYGVEIAASSLEFTLSTAAPMSANAANTEIPPPPEPGMPAPDYEDLTLPEDFPH